jgi:hypothetical protein
MRTKKDRSALVLSEQTLYEALQAMVERNPQSL